MARRPNRDAPQPHTQLVLLEVPLETAVDTPGPAAPDSCTSHQGPEQHAANGPTDALLRGTQEGGPPVVSPGLEETCSALAAALARGAIQVARREAISH